MMHKYKVRNKVAQNPVKHGINSVWMAQEDVRSSHRWKEGGVLDLPVTGNANKQLIGCTKPEMGEKGGILVIGNAKKLYSAQGGGRTHNFQISPRRSTADKSLTL